MLTLVKTIEKLVFYCFIIYCNKRCCFQKPIKKVEDPLQNILLYLYTLLAVNVGDELQSPKKRILVTEVFASAPNPFSFL